jgi:dCTP deaminase
MAKLSGSKIAEEVCQGRIIIRPFNEEYMGPNSYDLTLGPNISRYRSTPFNYHDVPDPNKVLPDPNLLVPLDIKKPNPVEEYRIPDDGLVLLPGELYLGHTNEVAGSCSYVPCIEGRSSLARLGIQIHLTAGFGDVGFVAQWTLEISVVRPVRIYKDIRVCQIYFDTIEGNIDKMYAGKYKDSRGVVESKIHEDFVDSNR